jgi:RNA polymerase sigma-70 factor, ECF subfamily
MDTEFAWRVADKTGNNPQVLASNDVQWYWNSPSYIEAVWLFGLSGAHPRHTQSWLAGEYVETYDPMFIPQNVVISLFFFIADAFPDYDSPESVDVPSLVARAQTGDRSAAGILYQLYSQAIFRYVVVRVPTSADAEDLTAEVFVSMVKGLPSYQMTGAPFEAWLYRIAASRVADFYRQAHRQGRKTELDDMIHDESPLPEEQVLHTQSLDQVRRALQQLPEEYQTILLLRFVERKSHEEVATLLDKSVPAIKSAQHRALLHLTELLGSGRKVRHYLRGSNHG